MAKQKLTAKQKQARVDAAIRRQEAQKAQRAAKERTKRIFVIAVCVILVVALGLPTVALSVMGGNVSVEAPVVEENEIEVTDDTAETDLPIDAEATNGVEAPDQTEASSETPADNSEAK